MPFLRSHYYFLIFLRRFRRALACNLLPVLMLAMDVQALEVVVNPANPATRLSRQELLAIFTMRQRSWPDGTPIVVLVQNPKSAAHTRFCKDLLNLFPHQLQTTWDRLVYSGSGRAPIELNSDQTLAEKLASTPGGIGYMESADSDAKAKTVIVDLPQR